MSYCIHFFSCRQASHFAQDPGFGAYRRHNSCFQQTCWSKFSSACFSINDVLTKPFPVQTFMKSIEGSNLWKSSGTTPVSFGLDAVLLVRVSRVASLVSRGIWFKILALSNDSQWLSMTHAFTVFSRQFWQPSRCSLLSTLWCKPWYEVATISSNLSGLGAGMLYCSLS